MYTVDLTSGTDFPKPIKGRPNLTIKKYRCVCDVCQSEKWLPLYQAQKAEKCFNCSQSDKGKKSMEKHSAEDRAKLMEGICKYQRENPSRAENTVANWLKEMGIKAETQVVLPLNARSKYIIDFVVGHIAIEVRGYWHNRSKGEKDAKLVEKWNGEVIFIDCDELYKNAASIKQALIERLSTVQ